MTFPNIPKHDPWWHQKRFEMGGDSPRLRDVEGPPLIEEIGPLKWTTFADGTSIHFNRARLAL
jgi:hypothetical protein